MPVGAVVDRSEQLATLSKFSHELFIAPKTGKLSVLWLPISHLQSLFSILHSPFSGGAMTLDEVLDSLKSQANPDNVAGMARFGINPNNTLGISIPTLRKLAKKIGKDHDIAQELWTTGIHEARVLAGFGD